MGTDRHFRPLVDTHGALWFHFRKQLGSHFRICSCNCLECVVFAKYARRPHGSSILVAPTIQKLSILGSTFVSVFGPVSVPLQNSRINVDFVTKLKKFTPLGPLGPQMGPNTAPERPQNMDFAGGAMDLWALLQPLCAPPGSPKHSRFHFY